MSDHLLITLPIPEPKAFIAKLKANFPKLIVTFVGLTNTFAKGEEVSKDLYSTCTIIYTLFALPTDPAKEAPNLSWVQFFSAGINNAVKNPIWADERITLTTSSGVHGPQISEWFTMTSLVSSHHYNILHDQQKQHNWDSSAVGNVNDMVGQRLGVLGYGSIGRQAARVAKAMGMDVIAYTAGPRTTPESKKDHGFIVPGTGDPDGDFPSAWYSGLSREDLHTFLRQDLDILLISVPLTKDTTHFISTEEFQILSKRKAFVSNISRGPIIKQDALVTALREEKVRGAALDVTDPEPLPEDSPLWDMENVIVTPHVSGRGSTYAERSFLIFEGNLGKRMRGEKMWNVVNRERGY